MEGRAKILLKAPSSPGSLFGMGRVEVETHDAVAGNVAVRIRVPALILQGCLPHLLSAGRLEAYSVVAPLGAWMPRLTADRMAPGIDAASAARRVNEAAQQCVNSCLEFFRAAASVCADPSDLVAALPLGTYVSVLFRGSAASLHGSAEAMMTEAGLGVPQFGDAVVSALAEAGIRPAQTLPSARVR